MNKDTFWELIQEAKERFGQDMAAAEDWLIDELIKRGPKAAQGFHDIMHAYPDARTIDTDGLPDFDLLCGGFPCQAFSHAGKRKGFADARGTLFFEIARVAEAKRPAYLLLENVPGLLSHNQGQTFAAILAALGDLGYHVEWSVLNSKYFGVPQSRKRVFLICYLDPRCAGKILPVFGADGKALIQIIGGPQGSRVYDPEGVACTQTADTGGMGGKTGLYLVGFNRKDGIKGERDVALSLNASDFRGINRNQTQNAVFVDLSIGKPQQTSTARCLTARYGQATLSNHKAERSGVLLIKEATKKGYKEAVPGDSVNLGFRSTLRRGRVGHDIALTLEASSTQGVVLGGGRIRRLMPRECLRLQGFADGQIDKILAINSDAQVYKQAGNSVTVTVIEAIGRRIQAVDEEIKGTQPKPSEAGSAGRGGARECVQLYPQGACDIRNAAKPQTAVQSPQAEAERNGLKVNCPVGAREAPLGDCDDEKEDKAA